MGPWLVAVTQRSELQPLLSDTLVAAEGRVLMVVRGDSGLVRELLPNALDAAKLDPSRRVMWIKDETVLSQVEQDDLFKGDPSIVAVVVTDRPGVRSWVYRDQIAVEDASFAFNSAVAG